MEKGREGKEEGEEGRDVLTRRGQWVHCGSYNTGSWKLGLPAPLPIHMEPFKGSLQSSFTSQEPGYKKHYNTIVTR